MHHSDRGVQYACEEYRQALANQKTIPSMSAKGYCYDNAVMESFFKTLKAEEVYLTEYETMDDVMKSIPADDEKWADKNLLEKRGIPRFIPVVP